MAKTDNLQDFLTDVANAIRTKTGTTQPINAQNFSTEILNIPTGGGGNTLKNLLDATHSCYNLFYGYSGTSVDALIKPNDTENVTNMNDMFYLCDNLTHIPTFNTSNVKKMYRIFGNCHKLTTIPALDVSNVTDLSSAFVNCSQLKSILMTGIKVSFDIHWSTMFERSDLLIILNNLETVTTTKTLKMGATNLAKLTEEEKAIATNKNWTLA